MEHIIHKIKV